MATSTGTPFFFGVDVDDRFGDGLTARGVQVFDELLEALFRIEMVTDVFAVLVPLAFVQQVQVDAFVQECQLTQRLARMSYLYSVVSVKILPSGLKVIVVPRSSQVRSLRPAKSERLCCTIGGIFCRRGGFRR